MLTDYASWFLELNFQVRQGLLEWRLHSHGVEELGQNSGLSETKKPWALRVAQHCKCN